MGIDIFDIPYLSDHNYPPFAASKNKKKLKKCKQTADYPLFHASKNKKKNSLEL
jgi:hypothetical protein